MVKTIFFDLDNTLLDFDRAEAVALRRALTEAGAPAEEAVLERYHVINRRQWELLEDGVLTREQVLVGRFALLFEELGADAGPGADLRAVRDVPGGGALVHSRSAGAAGGAFSRYDLYLASNGAACVQHSRLKSADLGRWFKGIFISQEVGADKPRREFFDRAFASIPGFSRETALMVGDSLTSDIRGGRNAGIRTCWFNRQRRSAPAGHPAGLHHHRPCPAAAAAGDAVKNFPGTFRCRGRNVLHDFSGGAGAHSRI